MPLAVLDARNKREDEDALYGKINDSGNSLIRFEHGAGY
jgi:hypothetical protein